MINIHIYLRNDCSIPFTGCWVHVMVNNRTRNKSAGTREFIHLMFVIKSCMGFNMSLQLIVTPTMPSNASTTRVPSSYVSIVKTFIKYHEIDGCLNINNTDLVPPKSHFYRYPISYYW